MKNLNPWIHVADALHLDGLRGLATQDCPVHIRAEVFALDAGKSLNVGTLLCWNASFCPLVNSGVTGQIKITSQLCHAARNVDCSLNRGSCVFHDLDSMLVFLALQD